MELRALRAQLEAAEAEWREKFEARTIDWSEASNALYVWRHRANDAEARAEAAEAESARCLTAMRRAVLALAHVSKDDPLYTDSYEVLSDAIAAHTKEQQA